MTILVEFSISTDRFELGRAIGQHEGLSAELERVVPADTGVVPYVWVTGPPETLDALATTLEESPVTTSVAVIEELSIENSEDYQYLFRIEWVRSELDIVKGIVDVQGDILEGESTGRCWLFRFRFETHGDVAEFYQYLADSDVTDFTLESVHEMTERSDRRGRFDLTPEQREALALAAMRGYFDSPRGTNLAEIGDELGITQQAVSDRIRRATRRVVFDALNLPEDDPGTGG